MMVPRVVLHTASIVAQNEIYSVLVLNGGARLKNKRQFTPINFILIRNNGIKVGRWPF